MKTFITKYFWVILIVLSLVLGFFIKSWITPDVINEDIKKWKEQVELLRQQHKTDSIEYAKIITFWKEKTKLDSLKIIETEKNYKLIKYKYEKELNRVSNFNANESLWFFTVETSVDPD